MPLIDNYLDYYHDGLKKLNELNNVYYIPPRSLRDILKPSLTKLEGINLIELEPMGSNCLMPKISPLPTLDDKFDDF